MASKTLTQRIALEGDDQIARRLAELGRTGEQAFARLGAAGKTAGDGMSASLERAGAASEGLAAKLSSAFGSIPPIVAKATVAIGGLVIAAKAVATALANAGAETVDKIDDAAKAANITGEAYQRLKSHADEAGVSNSAFEDALTRVRKVAQELSTGAIRNLGDGVTETTTKIGSSVVTVLRFGSAAETAHIKSSKFIEDLAQIGVSARDLVGKNPDEIMRAIANAVALIPDETRRANAGLKLFGDNWRELVPLFSRGGEALGKATEGARIFSDAQIKIGVALKAANEDLAAAVKFFRDLVGLLFAPRSTASAEWLTGMVDGARKLVFEFIEAAKAKKELLGGTFDVFKDLDLEKLAGFLREKGQGGIAAGLELVRNISLDLAKIWTGVLVPAGQAVARGFDVIANLVNSVFGTEITGRFVAVGLALGVITGAFTLMTGIIGGVVGSVATLLGVLGPLRGVLTAGGAAAAVFWQELRVGASVAVRAVVAQAARFKDAFSALLRGDFAKAWDSFRSAGVAAGNDISKAFGGSNTLRTAFEPVLQVISALRIALSGLAALFNAVFGTKISGDALALGLVLAGLTGVLGALAGAARFLVIALSPMGLALTALVSAGIILFRIFPQLSQAVGDFAAAASRLFSGDLSGAIEKVRAAFAGLSALIKQESNGTWVLLTAAVVGFGLVATSVITGLFALIARNPIGILVLAFAQAAILIIKNWEPIKQFFSDLQAGAQANLQQLLAYISGPFRSQAQADFAGLVEFIKQKHSEFRDSAQNDLAALAAYLGGTFRSQAQSDFASFCQSLADAFETTANQIIQKAQAVAALLKALFSGGGATGTEGGAGTGTETNPGGFASGGYVNGPGTATSDSILARLSKGEFVIRAAAVKHYGPGLLAALNGLRLPRMPGFSMGGVVEGLSRSLGALAIPRFADGGMVPAGAGNMRNLGTLMLRTESGESFQVLAPADVAEKLVRFASSKGVSSGGHSPSWKR